MKFICGAGKHCGGKDSVLKHKVYELATKELEMEAFIDKEKGNVLVRL